MQDLCREGECRHVYNSHIDFVLGHQSLQDSQHAALFCGDRSGLSALTRVISSRSLRVRLVLLSATLQVANDSDYSVRHLSASVFEQKAILPRYGNNDLHGHMEIVVSLGNNALIVIDGNNFPLDEVESVTKAIVMSNDPAKGHGIRGIADFVIAGSAGVLRCFCRIVLERGLQCVFHTQMIPYSLTGVMYIIPQRFWDAPAGTIANLGGIVQAG